MTNSKLSKQILMLMLLLALSVNGSYAQLASRDLVVSNIRSMLQDKKGNYWLGSDGEGVYRYDGLTLSLLDKKKGLCHNQVRSVQEDRLGNIWFETGNGICWYDGRYFTNLKGNVKTSGSDRPSEVWHKEAGDLWFPAGTWKGVYRYNGDSLFNYRFPGALDQRASSLPYDPYDIYCILTDRAGNIWFGTQSKGVCRFDGKDFMWLQGRGLSGAAVRAIFQDKAGNLWFGNNGYGLFRYDGKTLVNVTEEKKLSNPEFIKNFTEKPGTLARVWTINEDTDGNLWIGTIDAGAWRYDGTKMTNYTTRDGLTERGVTLIYKDKKGELWFGTAGEVCKFNGRSFVKVFK